MVDAGASLDLGLVRVRVRALVFKDWDLNVGQTPFCAVEIVSRSAVQFPRTYTHAIAPLLAENKFGRIPVEQARYIIIEEYSLSYAYIYIYMQLGRGS